ncbi:hypothetical protein BX257_8277 [Streptomyces sp. 3212.3]|nr:hypothetical protein BX257_8277 [Streptomyces sp. 3212.3]
MGGPCVPAVATLPLANHAFRRTVSAALRHDVITRVAQGS